MLAFYEFFPWPASLAVSLQHGSSTRAQPSANAGLSAHSSSRSALLPAPSANSALSAQSSTQSVALAAPAFSALLAAHSTAQATARAAVSGGAALAARSINKSVILSTPGLAASLAGRSASFSALRQQVIFAASLVGHSSSFSQSPAVLQLGIALTVRSSGFSIARAFLDTQIPPLPPITVASGRWRIVADESMPFLQPANVLSPRRNEAGFTLFFNTFIDIPASGALLSFTFTKPSGRHLTVPVAFTGRDSLAGMSSLRQSYVAYVTQPNDLDEAGHWRVYLSQDGLPLSGVGFFDVV